MIVGRYFDVGQSRSIPWQRGPQASERNPHQNPGPDRDGIHRPDGRMLPRRTPAVRLSPGRRVPASKSRQGPYKLEPDPVTAGVVWRIFEEFLQHKGIYTIAERLTRDGLPSPHVRPQAQPSPQRRRVVQERRSRHPAESSLHRPSGVEQAAQGRGAARPRRRGAGPMPPSCAGTTAASGSGPTSRSTSR